MPSVDVRTAGDFQQRRIRAIQFAGEQLWLHASGALLWPDQTTLVVSDLHLEKASYLSGHANPLPLLDTRYTLERLQQLIERYAPRQVICLGDSFHDAGAIERMANSDLCHLHKLIAATDRWLWILGNHDPELPKALPGASASDWHLAPLLFVHQPDERPAPQVIGHYHPKTHCRVAGQSVRGSCFVQTHNRLYMPAFGAFTGGLDVDESDFPASAHEAGRRRFLLFNQRVWQV